MSLWQIVVDVWRLIWPLSLFVDFSDVCHCFDLRVQKFGKVSFFLEVTPFEFFSLVLFSCKTNEYFLTLIVGNEMEPGLVYGADKWYFCGDCSAWVLRFILILNEA